MCCETLLFSGIFSNPQKFLDIEYLEHLANAALVAGIGVSKVYL
jgi:hypothetical protein